MRTLALPRGARVAVVAAQWRDVFAVVTRGRVQLELRDGEPGPVLGRDAGFWLRGTGVRALRNPGRRTARIRIITPTTGGTTMTTTHATAAPTRTHRFRGLARTGLLATLAAVVATTLAAALAGAAGVDFAIPDGGETIPLPGFAVVTGFFSIIGVVIAAALLRWSARPAPVFLRTALALTVLSFAPVLLAGADTGTTVALLALHLVPAAVMIPALTRSLATHSR
ncbi:DUF6069 family protein [Actinoplanes xinjiangensis]|uniref:DUF6069 family protein n=1 Tax=Actinoplanes xinjiangensis TaxID=512350 RepID=UPI003417A75C